MSYSGIVVAGTGSGCGKTMIACGMMKVFADMGYQVKPYKCGPDYIDPMYAEAAVGRKGENLDPYLAGGAKLADIFAKSMEAGSLAVVEGVMGYYDGIAGKTLDASTFDVAGQLKLPVLLVVDGKGKSLSLLAEIKGFLEYCVPSGICGILVNRVSAGHYQILKQEIEAQLDVKVYGYIPEQAQLQITSRYLGLQLPHEQKQLQEDIARFAERLRETIEIEAVLELAAADKAGESENSGSSGKRPVLLSAQQGARQQAGPQVPIAVARDEAFCFYYDENLRILEEAGAKLLFFSPLKDQELPEEAQGLILGGGYPELYAEPLSKNEQMRASIRNAVGSGLPCLAECGGFLYLHQELECPDGEAYPMCGVVGRRCWKEKKLSRFGYIELETKQPSVFGAAGLRIRGHEFHYYESSDPGDSAVASKPASGRSWECMHSIHSMNGMYSSHSQHSLHGKHGNEHLFAGFPHLYYGGIREYIEHFLNVCRDYKE